jgi:hypothetical protein
MRLSTCFLIGLNVLLVLVGCASRATADGPPSPPPVSPEPVTINGAAFVLNVKDKQFGATGDGVTNDAPAINKALQIASKTGEYGKGIQGTVVYIPPGIYRLDSPLDLNGRQFNIVGAGSYQTVLRGNTGDRTAVVELVGAGFCKLSGVLIDDLVDALPKAEQNPSSVGILLARVDAPQNTSNMAGPRFAAQSWANNLEDVSIRLRTRPQANGGHGTCAYYNFCCEVSNWHNCFFMGDTAALVSAANMWGVQMKTVKNVEWQPGTKEPMRMWPGESSMTVVRASGANGLFGITGPALIIGGGSDISIDSCIGHQAHLYLPNEPERWPRYAIEVSGICHNLAYRGSIEGYPGAMRIVGVTVSALDFRPYLDIQTMYDAKGAEIDSVPVIMLDKRKAEQPAGSGNFTNIGAVLCDSIIAPATTPNTTGVIGRLIDTSADASHVIQGNHFTLGNMSVRLRNSWATSVLRGNIATSKRPRGSGQLQTTAGISRGGNFVTTADGVETDGYVLPGAAATLPVADSERRGQIIRVEGAVGKPDELFICEKDAAGKYAWRKL